jgi:hypothetical protein
MLKNIINAYKIYYSKDYNKVDLYLSILLYVILITGSLAALFTGIILASIEFYIISLIVFISLICSIVYSTRYIIKLVNTSILYKKRMY